MNLTIKQQQFNAAMARFTAGKGYVGFGWLVATINSGLQLYLLLRVWPRCLYPGYKVTTDLHFATYTPPDSESR